MLANEPRGPIDTIGARGSTFARPPASVQTAAMPLSLTTTALCLAAHAQGQIEQVPTTTGQVAPRLEARAEEGFQVVCGLDDGLALVPLHSRSEMVTRVVRGNEGLVLRCVADDPGEVHLGRPRMQLIEHALEERLVQVDAGLGSEPQQVWRLAQARCAWQVVRASDQFDESPYTLRQDGEGVRGALLATWRDAQEGESLVLVPVRRADEAPLHARVRFTLEGEARTLQASTRSRGTDALVLAIPSGSTQARIDVLQGDLDQVQIARATRIALEEDEWRVPRATRPEFLTERDGTHALANGASLESSWDFGDDAPAGRTRTLVLQLSLDRTKSAPGPTRAAPSAPDELFVDATAASGVRLLHVEGEDLQLDIRPTMGPGAAWGDVDGDGLLDLYLPQGAGRAGLAPQSARFHRNLGAGRFVDETEARGLALVGAGMGALFVDLDGDGDLDLVALERGRARLMVNADGRFHERSAALGLPDGRWYTAAAAADVDRDGDLDLYVTSYLRYDEAAMPRLEEDRYQREDPVAMLPYAFPGEVKSLLLNEPAPAVEAAADGALFARAFRDVAPELKLDDPAGRGMQALFWDFDRDGDLDLSLANDVSPNRFWRNEGGGKFKDVGFSSGLDDPRGSMGLAAGDIDGDGDEDLFVSNWQLESNALYVNNLLSHNSARSRVATFRDKAVEAGVARPSVGLTGWGVELADFDNDGDLDAALANGYTGPDYEGTGICVGQPAHYYENGGEGRFVLATARAGAAFARPLASRAMCAADYDRDGDLDLVVTANNGVARLLENRTPRSDAWIVLRLSGADGNTHAIGAEATLEVGGRRLRRSLRAGTGYLSGNPPELHFGLGDARKIDQCTVRWPSGRESRHAIDAIGAVVTLHEPR